MNAETKILSQKNSPPFSPGVFAGVMLGATAIGVCAMVFFFNPSTHGFYPVCLFHQLTGLNCPGCGMTRGLYALLHGNLLLALKDNALFIFTIAFLAARGAKHFLCKSAGQFISPKMLWTFLIVAAVFTVLRNFQAFSSLS